MTEKRIYVGALVAFVLTILMPPHTVPSAFEGHTHTVWYTDPLGELNLGFLSAEWAGIGFITFLLIKIVGSK